MNNHFPKDKQEFSAVLDDRLIKYYGGHDVESVADFGCSRCEYVLNINAAGLRVQGFDGHPENEGNISFIKKLDLSQSITLPMVFYYVQSFGVNEQDKESKFIQNIVDYAQQAILRQKGWLHVSNRDNQYILSKIEAHEFSYDQKDNLIFRQDVSNHIQRTIMFFHKN